ncbi:galactokinase [Halalkalibacter lacteus]|uniref:galactokinase n=1 Tax=Halalkalibacter lacteus TaxID=3090663 RepID=UPI002FCB4EC8
MENIKKTFIEVFKETDQLRAFFAPGRVNLIGEHTDYNGGHVFPCALSIGTFAVARKRKDSKIRLYSMNFSDRGVIETSLENLMYVEEHDWANYPKGVVAKLIEADALILTGFDVVFNGTIPNGAGLSSSASIELVTAVMINEMFQLKIDQVELVKLAQKAENEYIGVQCGIMDQFAIGMGKKDHAILLDCQTLEATYSPIKLEDMSLVIINTNKKRGLADSKYNDRRSECQEALTLLQQVVSIESLGDLSIEEFEKHKHVIKNDTVQKRAKHAVSENERTVLAVEKLNAGDVAGFGKLMNESHISLRDDYEVTGQELDALVQAASDAKVVGARMTGAGFGGCTVNLVHKEQLADFIERVSLQYAQQTGLKADFYTVEIGDKAKEITL